GPRRAGYARPSIFRSSAPLPELFSSVERPFVDGSPQARRIQDWAQASLRAASQPVQSEPTHRPAKRSFARQSRIDLERCCSAALTRAAFSPVGAAWLAREARVIVAPK